MNAKQRYAENAEKPNELDSRLDDGCDGCNCPRIFIMLRRLPEKGEFVYVPIYEYACRSCEHQFETIQKASEPVLTDCPECGTAALRKLLSAPVFRLKGSGWYETDFKTGDKKNVAGNGEPDKAESAEGKHGDGKTTDAADGTAKKPDDSKTKDTKATDTKAPSTAAGSSAKAD